ncbi:unnamed protein product [Clonostachys rhizophaga]|uniref:Ubiquitin-like protease family profile domain-containing protein n=1 Tax=Clonostachys rhizophaga TaxID=160324 RepID=A0A9N9VC42_9HYPO|nr:unnamed protein product [Clonostachys rhizophaga]
MSSPASYTISSGSDSSSDSDAVSELSNEEWQAQGAYPYEHLSVRPVRCGTTGLYPLTPQFWNHRSAERLPFYGGQAMMGPRGPLCHTGEISTIMRPVHELVRTPPPVMPYSGVKWPPRAPQAGRKRKAFKYMHDRNEAKVIYEHLKDEGNTMSYRLQTTVQNLHNLMSQICRREQIAQEDLSTYLHEMTKDIQEDLVYIPNHCWDIWLEQDGGLLPGTETMRNPVVVPRTNFKESDNMNIHDRLWCRRFVANIVYVQNHFFAFVLDRKHAFVHILDTSGDGRDIRAAAFVNSLAVWLNSLGFSMNFAFAVIPCTPQRDCFSCGILCAQWLRQTLRDFIGERVEQSGIPCISLNFRNRPFPTLTDSYPSGLFVRDWAIRPQDYEGSRRWAKTEMMINICTRLSIPSFPQFFRQVDQIQIHLMPCNNMLNHVRTRLAEQGPHWGFMTFAGAFRIAIPAFAHEGEGPNFGLYYFDERYCMLRRRSDHSEVDWVTYTPRPLPPRITPATLPVGSHHH